MGAMPESRGCAASTEVREKGWVLELCCNGSWYSLGRLRNSMGTWERDGGKELDQATVALPTMTRDFYKSNVILHWTFIRDFLPSSLSCKLLFHAVALILWPFLHHCCYLLQISFLFA